MLAWGFRFWMWRLTLTCGILFLMSAEYSVVMCRACLGTLVTWPWHCLGMIYCCALRLWSQICVTCQSCWFLDLAVVGFYDHEPSWSCSLWLRNCLWLWSVGHQPNPSTWWNTWPPGDWCSWPIMGCCCNTHRELGSLFSVGSHFDGSGSSELVC